MKIVLKGVQRVEDVLKAIEYGVDGVVLSNHGGRQLDTARSGIEILGEVSLSHSVTSGGTVTNLVFLNR